MVGSGGLGGLRVVVVHGGIGGLRVGGLGVIRGGGV